MDMKQLIAQIDHIESKQILNEDAHYTTAQVDNRPRVSKSNDQTSIYEMLIKEFGYDLDERVTINPDGTTSGGIAPAPAAAVKNPYQGADAAKFAAMSPADQAWLTKGGGVPDINDEIILGRAPNKGVAVAPAAPAGGQAASPGKAINPETGQEYTPVAGGAAQPAAASAQPFKGQTDEFGGMESPPQAGSFDSFGNPVAAGDPAAASADPTGLAQAQQDVNAGTPVPGGAAQPAKPAANKSMTPAITAYASRMGLLKNNKPDVAAIKKFQQDNGLKADGIIGPNTAGAILSAQKPGASGRGGPTAAQAAQAAPAATKPADLSMIDKFRTSVGIPAGGTSPTGKSPRYKTPQEFDQEIARFSKTSDPKLPPNARYIATLQAEKAALGSGGAAQPAATKSALPGVTGVPGAQISNTPAAESVRSQDDAILERIRTALFR